MQQVPLSLAWIDKFVNNGMCLYCWTCPLGKFVDYVVMRCTERLTHTHADSVNEGIPLHQIKYMIHLVKVGCWHGQTHTCRFWWQLTCATTENCNAKTLFGNKMCHSQKWCDIANGGTLVGELLVTDYQTIRWNWINILCVDRCNDNMMTEWVLGRWCVCVLWKIRAYSAHIVMYILIQWKDGNFNPIPFIVTHGPGSTLV